MDRVRENMVHTPHFFQNKGKKKKTARLPEAVSTVSISDITSLDHPVFMDITVSASTT
jgi:hypothetical protein